MAEKKSLTPMSSKTLKASTLIPFNMKTVTKKNLKKMKENTSFC